MDIKKDGNSVEILGINLISTSADVLLRKIVERLKARKKTFVVTPNPEFLVYSQKRPWFRQILNSATFAIPDGIGLVWASWFLGTKPRLRQRITGADLAEKLLRLANKYCWRVGVVGARRGEIKQRQRLVNRLQQQYPKAKIANLEETQNWQKKEWQLIFACQGMGEQEKWIGTHFDRVKASLFIGSGGSLDYLAGFVRRAPLWLRQAGFEWLYRLVKQPWRWRRQLALVRFFGLVIKAKF